MFQCQVNSACKVSLGWQLIKQNLAPDNRRQTPQNTVWMVLLSRNALDTASAENTMCEKMVMKEGRVECALTNVSFANARRFEFSCTVLLCLLPALRGARVKKLLWTLQTFSAFTLSFGAWDTPIKSEMHPLQIFLLFSRLVWTQPSCWSSICLCLLAKLHFLDLPSFCWFIYWLIGKVQKLAKLPKAKFAKLTICDIYFHSVTTLL